MPFSLDALFFESALPTDGRMHSIDVRDAAAAFTAATTADVVGEILLIGGDESHLLRQGDVGKALAAARGLTYVLPGGRPGDPDSDADWFVTDWMDTARSERVAVIPTAQLAGHAAEMRAAAGWRRYPMRLAAPLARMVLKRRAAYRNAPGRYANPWGAIRAEMWRAPFRRQRLRPGVVADCGSAGVPQPRLLVLKPGGQLDNRGQLSEEIDRGCDGAVDEGSEVLERHAFADPLGSAGHNTDALWVRGAVQDRGDFAVPLVPRVGEARQPGAVGDGVKGRGSDPNDDHVAERGGDLEVDVQSRMGVGDEEVFAIVLAPEEPQPAGGHVAFDEGRTGRSTVHGIDLEARGFGDPLSRAFKAPKNLLRIC